MRGNWRATPGRERGTARGHAGTWVLKQERGGLGSSGRERMRGGGGGGGGVSTVVKY